jgi:D-alanine-D-alanine ligase
MDGKKTTKNGSPRTLGPVSDLERHLPSDWWKTLFNSVYLKTDGDVVEHEGNTAREVDLLVRAAMLDPNDRILDLCCGQGRHCIELARRGFRQVAGLDRSRYLIRLARKRARQIGLNVSFHEGDARKFRLPENTYHCVVVFGNSFGYFEREDDDVAVLDSIKRVLLSEGTLAMDLVDGEWMRTNFEPRSWEWIDQDQFVCRERSLTSDNSRLVSREVVVHAERGVIADQFYAERLYTKDTIRELLDQLGYSGIRYHGAVPTDSDRNQDLGMMSHRMFITARAPKKVYQLPRPAKIIPDITVVMGDPIMPDTIKRDGKFNEEDFETIDRLKAALGELDGYRFDFLNNHATLVNDISSRPPSFVMNLCDEGYNNDAFKELHVPALLEMYDIPYTGAGPACLGMCYNKSIVRSIAQSVDIPVPLETYHGPEDQMASLPSIFPALLKPNYGDSSVGITMNAVVNDPEELMAYLQELRETLPGIPVLIQEFLSGPEYSVGIVGNTGSSYHILPVLEVDYSNLDPSLPKILGYESKWLPDSPYWNQMNYKEANIDEETRRKLMDYSNTLFERLACRDYARFDFRTDSQGEIKLLEVNPNPGWCWDGKFNLMASFEGLRYADLLRMILESAQERILAKNGVFENSGVYLVTA